MKKRRHWAVMPAVLVGITIVGVAWTLGYGGFFGSERESLSDDSATSPHPPVPGAIAVTIAPVRLRPVQRTVVSVGTLHAFEQVTVSAKVEGRVRRIMHDVGDRVKPGDLLLEIDPTDSNLSVRQAQSALDVEMAKLGLTTQATADFDVTNLPSVVEASVKLARIRERMERVRSLVERGAMSRDELSNLTSDSRSLQAEHDNQILLAKSGLATIQMKQEALAIVRQQLKDTQIAAPQPSMIPFAAHDTTYAVTSRTAAEGSFLRAGTEVFKLVMDRMLKLRVPVPDRYEAEVQVGQKAKVTTAAYDCTFEGTVRRINPAVDPATRTFEVEIQLANTNGALKSGSFAKAAIETRFDSAVPTVPLEAIVRFAGITKIFLVEKGRVREIQVSIGTATDRWVEIAGARISANAQVVTSGQTVLADGAQVYVRPTSVSARGPEHQPARD
jgi:RND family efflux transporter MFP subunit